MTTFRTIALLVSAALLSAPALAQSQSQSQSQDKTSVAAIEQRYAELHKQQTFGRKLGALDYQRLAHQRAQVQELIDRAEAGQSVTPGDVDRALGQAQ